MIDIYVREDDEAFKSTDSVQMLAKEDFGVSNTFSKLSLEPALRAFSYITTAKTPFDKLLCLKDTIDQINVEASSFNEAISSDDLLPLLVFIIVQSNLRKLHSNFVYIENFLFVDISTNELG